MGRYDIVQPSPLLRALLCFVTGILLQNKWPQEGVVWAFCVCVVLTLLLRRWEKWQGAGVGVCILLLGMVLTGRQQARLSFPADDKRQALEAVVISETVEKPKTVAADLLLTGSCRRVKAYIEKDEQSLSLSPGDGLRVVMRIEKTDTIRLGTFDYGQFLLVNGFTGRCYVRSADWQPQNVSASHIPGLDRLRIRALQLRHRLLSRYHTLATADDASASLVAAMTLGDRTGLSREQRDVFATSGTAHILALSGLHMGILFGLFTLLPVFWRRSAVVVVFVVALSWGFALLTGLSVSVVRSAVMLTVASLCAMRGWRTSVINVLCFAALIILLFSPLALFDVGFQLSFLSVLAILMLMPVLDSFWSERNLFNHPFLRVLWGLLAVGFAAQVGTAPLVAFCFGHLPLYFLLSTLVAIPCAYAILWLSLCYLLLPLPCIGSLLLFVAGSMNGALANIASWPYASIGHLEPTARQTVLIYAVLVSVYLIVVRMKDIRIRL